MIGGSFDINPQTLRDIDLDIKKDNKINYYCSGTSALYHIMLYLRDNMSVNKVLLPDYLCHTIVNAANHAKVDIEFYPIQSDLYIDRDNFLTIYNKKNCAVLIINYFGMMDIASQVSFIRAIDQNAIIIEDDVQAYYAFDEELGELDFKCTSLRKTFPIPDGGLVKGKYKLKDSTEQNVFSPYMYAGAILKSQRNLVCYGDDIYLELFEKGEKLLNENLDNAMSPTSLSLFNSYDIKSAALKRCENARHVLEGLKSMNIRTIMQPKGNQVPLFIPIYLENRNKVRSFMAKNNVFCPIHWPIEDKGLVRGKDMFEHELSLIVDQRYSIDDMDLILDLLNDSIK